MTWVTIAKIKKDENHNAKWMKYIVQPQLPLVFYQTAKKN